ncbi:MAG: ChbG/HpnK family deacetylase [Candidatus Omnitrophica bacterium]|nr:ChbG/HpnK family deacetylase [Candidatus Omnitrophota bacterium]
MKKLVINADDAGLSSCVNEAVIKCLEEGAVTGTSVMPCGESFSEASAMLKDAGVTEAGLHITLTGGFKPASSSASEVYSLLGEEGRFPATYIGLFRRLAAGKVSAGHLRKELGAQLDALREEGLTVTHIDSHEHVHMFPGILSEVIALAGRSGVEYVRFPCEWSGFCVSLSVKDILRHSALKFFALLSRRKFREVKHNDLFMGHYHAGRVDEEVLGMFIENAAEGLTEVAVHPCAYDAEFLEKNPWYANGPAELEALLSEKWKKKIREGGVRLVSHGEAVRA